MATGIVRAFDVGVGDCVFLLLREGDRQFSVMVDCGRMTPEVREWIEKELNRHIDLVVVTHIDGDHVVGVKSVLQEIDGLTVGRILYNCGQQCKVDGPRVDQQQLDALRKDASAPTIYGCSSEVSERQALTLAEVICENESFRKAWENQRESITVDTPVMKLADGFGEIRFLSPEDSALGKLDMEMRRAFNNHFYRKYEGPYQNESTLFELLIRGVKSPYESGGSVATVAAIEATKTELQRLADADISRDGSLSNNASIAFVWSGGDKRILFCGDAWPDVMVHHYLRNAPPIESGFERFEVIKVPHHGSAYNCGDRFWDTFDSQHIFICGRTKDERRPSKECLAKIVTRPTDDGKRILHVTGRSKCVDWIDKENLREEFNFSITEECSYEFEY